MDQKRQLKAVACAIKTEQSHSVLIENLIWNKTLQKNNNCDNLKFFKNSFRYKKKWFIIKFVFLEVKKVNVMRPKN